MGKAIRFCTRDKNEEITHVNHIGMIVTSGEHTEVEIVESLHKTVRRKLVDGYGDLKNVAIARKKNLTPDDALIIRGKMESYVGRTYGYLKILLHLGDFVLKRLHKGNEDIYFFRRFGKMDRYPICIYSFAQSYAKAGILFSKPPEQLQPDDIWDYVIKNQHEYDFIHIGDNIVYMD